MKRVGLYVRVSTQEQKKHGLSVDSQITALEAYSRDNNYKVYKIYNDAGISARKRYTKRPALLELIEDCKQGKIDLILFTKLDRWFRSVGDYYEVQRQLEDSKVPWRAIWEDYETETSSGIFKVNIMLSVAQSEADRTSERIKSTFEYKRACGDYIGSAPTGYKRENKRLVKNPEEEEEINLLFSSYIKTHSSTKACAILGEHGYNWSTRGIIHVLNNPTYRGNAKGSICEPYLTPEQAEEIDTILKSNYRTPKNSMRPYMFARIVYCDTCNCKMRCSRCGNHGEYNTYNCSGKENLIKHKNIGFAERKLERIMLENLRSVLKNPPINAEVSEKESENTLRKKKAIEGKLQRVGVRFEDGDISIEEYRSKRAELLQELSKMEIATPKQAPEMSPNWEDIYKGLDLQHKSEFWHGIVKEIHVSGNKEVSVLYK